MFVNFNILRLLRKKSIIYDVVTPCTQDVLIPRRESHDINC